MKWVPYIYCINSYYEEHVRQLVAFCKEQCSLSRSARPATRLLTSHQYVGSSTKHCKS